MFEDLQEQAVKAFHELCEISHFRKGSLIVIGGSSSEIRGGHIGKDSSYEVGTAVVTALMEAAEKEGLYRRPVLRASESGAYHGAQRSREARL